jgi:hypothetical protein
MDEMFLIAIFITVAFCVAKFIELKYFQDELKPLKDVVRDCVLVMLCSLGGSFMYFHFQTYIQDFFNVVTETKVLNTASTEVFTDTPNF